MLLRIRWFLFGALSSTAALIYAAVQVRRVRRRLSPAALARDGGRRVASLLDRAADRIDPPSGAAVHHSPATMRPPKGPRSRG